MDLKAGMTLIPPTVKNSSCTHPRYSSAGGGGTNGGGGVGGTVAGAGNYSFLYHIGFMETIEAILILILTLGVIGANAMIIFVINNRRYTPYIPQQPRYLLTSLALNDLAIGLLITPFGLIPALFKCWPYGEIFCQIQALLRGALSQQSAVILICMAIDRYMCALHPRRYQQHSSKKGCVAILSLTWIINLTVFGLLVLPKGYYFNNTGLMACEPFYSKPSYRILATCALYFPTTMVLMYCYGLSFHLSRFRLITEPIQQSGTTISSQTSLNATIKKITLEERHLSASTSRSMAAISLGFIVMVTPWTIQEIVTACTGSKLPRFLDFLVTWTALSNSFWNPFIYWVLNSHFRRLSKFLLSIQWCPHEEVPRHKGHCCNINSECDPLSTLPFPPPPHPPHSYSIRHSTGNDIDSNDSVIGDGGVSSRRGDGGGGGGTGASAGGIAPYYLTSIRPDIEGLSEKYWGEILERTLSSGSLYALQKTFSSSQEQQKQQREQTQSHHQHHSQNQQQHHQQYDYQQHEPHRHHHRYSSHAHQQHQHQQQQQQQQSINFNKNSDLIATITGQCEQHCNDVDNDATNGNRVINLSDCEDDDDDEDDDDNDEDEDVNELQDHQQQQQQQQQQLHQHQHQHQKHQGRFNINDFSSSELKLCEHIYHDVNCAKNKAAAAAAAAM